MAKEKMKPLRELNLTNRFLFDQVMEDIGTQQDVLSMILGKEIKILSQVQAEKEHRISPLAKSIRMDIFSIDEEQTVYNTEMQNRKNSDLAKRSRYYQSLMDTSLLKPGEINYNLLNDSYLIMIMTFDLFGKEKYCYTFRPKCEEVENCVLNDGTTRIFLNTKGKNGDEVSKELAEFLTYVENSSDQVAEASESPRIKRLHNRVSEVRASEEIGVKYMQAWEEKYYDKLEAREEGRIEGREEGKEEGRAQGRREILEQQVQKKLAKGKSISEIAEALEEDTETIRSMIEELNVRRGEKA